MRVYNGADGSGAERGNAWSDANGDTAFYLVEGDYGYLVEKNAATSAKSGFTVAARRRPDARLHPRQSHDQRRPARASGPYYVCVRQTGAEPTNYSLKINQ